MVFVESFSLNPIKFKNREVIGKVNYFFSPLFYFFTWLSAFVNLGLDRTFVYLGFHGS